MNSDAEPSPYLFWRSTFLASDAPSSGTYRPDIDGLRAIAILPVVWLHSGLPGLPGGFSGVDTFFVISGYLITLIVHRETEAGIFSFTRFYERRIRRIAPAFLLMMAAATSAAFVLLLSDELEAYARTAVAALAMASNIYFWRGTNYFSFADSLTPLLHTWSLGVEEQFYLVFPAVIVMSTRLGIKRVAIATLGALSFTACLAQSGSLGFPSTAFYLLPTRAWELMAGAALAVGIVVIPDRFSAAASIIGTAMILAACLLLSRHQPYPGWRALLPTVGAVLLIGAGSRSPVARVLSTPPAVALGRVSYSLYLWHWPIFVYLRHWQAEAQLSPATAIAAILLSLLLATVSYVYIEQPARRRATSFRQVLLASIVGAVALVLALGIAIVGRGLPQRLPPFVTTIRARANAYAPLAHICTDLPFGRAVVRCRIGPGGDLDFVIWGDSHAAAISEGVAVGLGTPGLIMSRSSCAPSVDGSITSSRGWRAEDCRNFDARVLGVVERDRSVSTVILSVFWDGWTQSPYESAAFWSAQQRLVDRLLSDGKRVFVIAGIPHLPVQAPWAAAIRARFGRPPLLLSCKPANIPLKRANIVDVSSGFCGKRADLMLTDENHVSRLAGLTIIAPKMAAAAARDSDRNDRS